LQVPPKFTQIVIFALKIFHLATLAGVRIQRGANAMFAIFGRFSRFFAENGTFLEKQCYYLFSLSTF
jgi:hypothetical protein